MLYLEAAEDSVDVSNGLHDRAYYDIPRLSSHAQTYRGKTVEAYRNITEILSKLLPLVSSKIYLFTIFKKPLVTS